MFNTVKLQSFTLKENLQEDFFVLTYPQKWIDGYQRISFELRPYQRHISFKTLESMLLGWDVSIVYVNNFNQAYKNPTWIISKKEIDLQVAFYLFYMMLEKAVHEIRSLAVKTRFEQWMGTLAYEDLGSFSKQTIQMTDHKGNLASDEVFQLLPRLVHRQLAQSPLEIDGRTIPFLDVGEFVLTDPKELFLHSAKKDYFYSLKVTAQIQTTPDTRKPILNIKLAITRWMTDRLPLYKWRENDTTVFIKVNDRLQMAKLQKERTFFWEPLFESMYNDLYIGQPLPNAEEFANHPSDSPNFYASHRAEFGTRNMPIGSGETMQDRHLIYEHIEKCLGDMIVDLEPLKNIRPKVRTPEKRKLDVGQVEKNRTIIASAINHRPLTIEVYYSGEQPILDYVRSTFGDTLGIQEGTLKSSELDVTIAYHQMDSLLIQLKDMKNPRDRHEQRIFEVQEKFKKANDVTACLILLPYKDQDDRLVFEAKLDPKKAIRAGFATTNRLTQFLTPSVEEDAEHRTKAAIYDLYRQLGYIDDYVAPRSKEINYFTPVTALHVMNTITTPYGRTKQALVTVSRESNDSPLQVECPALWQGKKLYWEACLAFQRIATAEGIAQFKKNDVLKNIKEKLLELHYNSKEPRLVLVDSIVTRNTWKLIADKNLSQLERIDPYTLKSIWFDERNKTDALDVSQSQLRIIRMRANHEVPDYLVPRKETGFVGKSGIFKRENVFYSLAQRPLDPQFSRAYLTYSKLNPKDARRYFKFPRPLELYPIHLHAEDDPEEWISLVHRYREVVHQYKDTLRFPVFMHLARLLEEYVY